MRREDFWEGGEERTTKNVFLTFLRVLEPVAWTKVFPRKDALCIISVETL